MIDDQTVLVIGGAGSVGSAITRRLLSREPAVVRILDNSEPSLASLQSEFGSDDRCRFLAGDIREKQRLDRAMEDIDVVVHAAAMKHVDISEYNPFEAVKTNVIGLQNSIDAAIDAGVSRFVFTSSDKAVNPANTMGTTKLLGEKLTTAGNKYAGRQDLALASVRFGNVINSSRSVIPRFHNQIRQGGPVELTDERMTRFFLTYEDISALVFSALKHMEGGEVFVQQMDAIRIADLATAMVDLVAPEYGHDPDDVAIETVGKRPGETLHEEIMTEQEIGRARENGSLYAILPERTGANGAVSHGGLDGFTEPDKIIRSSERASKLDSESIEALLEETELVEEIR